MGRVSARKRGAQSVTLDGSNQDDGRFALVSCGLSIGCVEFDEVVTTNIGAQRLEFIVRQVSDEG